MNNAKQLKKITKKDFLNIISSLIIFYISPLISLFIFYFVLLKKNRKIDFLIFTLLITLYITIINVSKGIETDLDLQWYSEQYLDAGNLSYIEYIFSFGINGKGKELFFPTFNYIIYFFIGNNVLLYRGIHCFVCYGLIFYATYRFANKLNIKYRYTGISILVTACFPWIFTYSATILRQFLAASLLIWITVEHFLYNKKMIIPTICMFLSHTSSLLFIPILYLPFFKKEISSKTFFYYLLGALSLILIQPIAEILFNLVGNSIPALAYVLERASTDTTFILPPLGIDKILFLTGEILIVLLLYYKYKIQPDNIMGIINIIMILNVFILINLSQLELSNRLFSYSVFFFPLILCYIFTRIKPGRSVAWSLFISLHLILILYYNTSMHIYHINWGIIFFPHLFI